jgi:hypothetical protein
VFIVVPRLMKHSYSGCVLKVNFLYGAVIVEGSCHSSRFVLVIIGRSSLGICCHNNGLVKMLDLILHGSTYCIYMCGRGMKLTEVP